MILDNFLLAYSSSFLAFQFLHLPTLLQLSGLQAIYNIAPVIEYLLSVAPICLGVRDEGGLHPV